jgi:hypothetical protein
MRYWLAEWLDENNIDSGDAALRRLDSVQEITHFQERAAKWEPQFSEPVDGTTVLAGAGLDLAGEFSCPSPPCQKRAVDKLFRHVWHYFDRIVLEDRVTHKVAHHWTQEPEFIEELRRHIGALVYIRQIGAESLVEFRQKAPATAKWRGVFGADHSSPLVRAHDSVMDELVDHVEFDIENRPGGEMFGNVRFSEEEVSTGISIPASVQRQLPAADLRRYVVSEVCNIYSSYLTSDILTARQLQATLGASAQVHRQVLVRAGGPQPVAFHLDLPVLEAVPIETLIRIRNEEEELFHRFQTRLRLAIEERSKFGNEPDPQTIAEEIKRDLIEPELGKIRERLQASEKVMTRKAAVGGFLATLTTTCGLLVGAAPVAALVGGVAVLAPSIFSAASKHLEEKRDVEMEDLYFLWKAIGHA